MKREITRPWVRQNLQGFACGAVLGAIVFLVLYGPATLNVTYDSWIRCGYVEEDIIQHYAAWQYFRNAAWEFPLTWISNAAAPVGAAAAWADVLPWAALFFKLLAPVLPATFQYFGIVSLLHYMLQGGFAWLLIALFDRRRGVCVPGVLLLCCWPVLIERTFRHTALSAQWLILWMLYLYFTSRRQKNLPWFSWCVLFGLIPGIHAYFLPMAFGLLCAAALENMIRNRRFGRPLALAAGSVAIALICARGLGVIMPNSSTSDGEAFGRYSMNLNALLNPSSVDFYTETGSLDWSLFLPQLQQQRLQYDGFNYLGLGVLAALAVLLIWGVVWLCRVGFGKGMRLLGRRIVDHIGLVLACLAFTMFAVSNVVFWGNTQLLSFRLPAALEAVFTSFRASGRIFWPVGYLLGLSVIVFCTRRFPPDSGRKRYAACLVLCAVLALQWIDSGNVLAYKGSYFRGDVLLDSSDFESEKAMQLIANSDTIRCMGNMFDYRLAECIIRSNPDIQTDIIFFARGNFSETYARYEQNYAQLISGAPIDAGTLYIASERSVCDEVLATAHEDVVAWQIGKFFLFGVATDERPAPDYR